MRKELHTEFAGRAVELAEVFDLMVGTIPVPSDGGGPPFILKLSTPHGPSTGGGKQGIQHVTLNRNEHALVIGSLHRGENAAELRAFEEVAAAYAQRWSTPLPLSPAAYAQVVDRLRKFSADFGLAVTIRVATPVPVAAPPPPVRNRVLTALALIVVSLAVGVGAAFLAMR